MPRKKPSRRTTIRDVAETAGVSTATVSKFINGLQRFTPEVEAKLRQAIDDLGYQQNRAARSMVTGKTGAIGIAVLDISNPYFTNIIKGANRMALTHNHDLLVVDLEENLSHEQTLLEALSSRVDGLIVSYRISEESINHFRQKGKPVVYFGKLDRPDITSVRTDGYRAAYLMGRHLIETGHKRIAYLGYSGARWNPDRIRGLSEALAESGLQLDIRNTSAPTMEGGRNAAAAILKSTEKPDAIAACNDLVALGVMHGLQAQGLRIPQDIAIAGIDNIPYAEYSNPPLTSVDTRGERLGEFAVHRLLERINSPNEPADDIVLEPRLIVRGSTQPLG